MKKTSTNLGSVDSQGGRKSVIQMKYNKSVYSYRDSILYFIRARTKMLGLVNNIRAARSHMQRGTYLLLLCLRR